jgi:lipoyl(octanoyl) transferase
MSDSPATNLRRLGMRDYSSVWADMRAYTDARASSSADELWLVQHPAVFTLGQAGKREHVLSAGTIPVIKTDRGGQVTYHGPGQAVLYCLLDLRRLRIGVKSIVASLEDSVIAALAEHGIDARRRSCAPGVYVGEAKIAALGLRVRNGCTYHGVALNVDLDLEPFSRINPCGYVGLQVTSMAEQGIVVDVDLLGAQLAETLVRQLGVRLADCGDVRWCAQLSDSAERVRG